MSEWFSVYQFFADDKYYECFVDHVPVEVAIPKAYGLATSIGAQIGTTKRVIITDSGDCCVWEWKHGEGVTFPPEAATLWRDKFGT